MLAGTEPTSLPQSQGPVDLKELKTVRDTFVPLAVAIGRLLPGLPPA